MTRTIGGRVNPDTVEEAIEAWDKGDQVLTVLRGDGSYNNELAIQTAMFELLRAFSLDVELGERVRSIEAALDDNTVARLEIVLVSANSGNGLQLDEDDGQAAAELALAIWRDGYWKVKDGNRDMLNYIGNPFTGPRTINRADRRAIAAQERKH